MKKFDRLPPEQRKAEIRQAAMKLFLEKGFASTTMENIVSQVSLSKGGVYRLYPSAEDILKDLILEGMRLRNAWYAKKLKLLKPEELTITDIAGYITQSLFIHEDFSKIYVEFLWEKQRSSGLEALYREICRVSEEETLALLSHSGAPELLQDREMLQRITDIMNTAILGIRVLGIEPRDSKKLSEALARLLM